MSYAYAHRHLDYSAPDSESMSRAVLRFVYGINDRRANAVSLKQIEGYFQATPPDFTRSVVDRLIKAHQLVMLRNSLNRKRTGYVYDITNQGSAHLYGDSVWDTPKGHEVKARCVTGVKG